MNRGCAFALLLDGFLWVAIFVVLLELCGA
jgi:hypothetical protein